MTITGWREKIDEMDRLLVQLLNQRAAAAQAIGRLKLAEGLPIYEPQRETRIYRNVSSANRGPLPEFELLRVFERIIDVMRKIQQAPEPDNSVNARAGGTELDARTDD